MQLRINLWQSRHIQTAACLLLALVFIAGIRGSVVAGPGQAPPQAESVPGELVIGLADGISAGDLSFPDRVSISQSSRELDALNAVLLSVPDGQEESIRRQLLSDPRILYAEPNNIVRAALLLPNDPFWTGGAGNPYTSLGQYGPANMRAVQAWNLSTGSTDTIIAIIDSGIDSSHPEFAGRLAAGYDFVQHDNSPQDECGHGTHVAGIAAATGNNSIGIAGINWRARILPVRVLNNHCSGTVLDVAEGIVWAVEQGARVINLSLGLASNNRLMEDATYYAYQHRVAVFAAAGNSGTTPILYPAAYQWVAAIGNVNSVNIRSTSNYGPELDLVASGVDILSTTPLTGTLYYSTTHEYGLLSGTSMSAAYAAGAASLMLAYDPAKFYSPDRIYHALEMTALGLGGASPNNYYGWGLVQIDQAMTYSGAFPPDPPSPPPAVEYDRFASTQCQNVSYDWRTIQHIPATKLPIITNDGYSAVSFPPGFFAFGGDPYTTLTVSANGYLSFDASGGAIVWGQKTNAPIPLPSSVNYSSPDLFIAPFWDDLNPAASSGAAIYAELIGTAPNREFVVEWYQVPTQAHPTSTTVTFQVVLFESSNQVLFQYQDLAGLESDGSSATIGLEYNNGYSGSQYSFNQPGALANEQALLFTPHPPGSARTTGCFSAIPVPVSGGSFDFSPFSLEIPNSLLSTSSTLRFNLFTSFSNIPAEYINLGRFAEITLEPTPPFPFRPQPSVCFIYSAADLVKAGGRPENLFIAVYEPLTNQWEQLVTSVSGSRICAPIEHLSIFGVFTAWKGSPAVVSPPKRLPVTGAPQVRQDEQ